MDTYQEYIHRSRYARYLWDQNRRETWDETVGRYISFMQKHVKEKHGFSSPELFETLKKAILNMEVMPSMRAMMTAGRALERDNVAGYNCAFLPVDDPKSFDEAMFILLCGTGVGFSVEQHNVDKLPEVPDALFESNTTIKVKDSKEGWAKSLRELIVLLYAGQIPKWDVTQVRPAGAPLKTFGGRASGPEPLVDLFQFVTAIFKNAVGRRLTSLECHDIMCKIGDVVVVGGVRRSAMISLSDLGDYRLRHAKSGVWWKTNPQRMLSNNSAVYEEKPSLGQFMEEWKALYESGSGERGIFSREASRKVVSRNGRRDPNHQWGVNPCSEIVLRPYEFCNLSEVIVRSDDTMETLARKVELATIIGTLQSTLTHFPYLRKIWKKNTEEERLLGVSLTGIYDCKMMSNPKDKTLPERLSRLRELAVETNKDLAEKLGIPHSAAITCVKPSGTVSQLTDSASGIHPRHDKFYFRRVRSDNKDPLTTHLKMIGIPNEPDIMKPDHTTVFTFPMAAPKGATLRSEVTALDHLQLWLLYQRHWCEHKPSVTISISEDEWLDVASWVYKHFDEVSGISFLPYDGGTYQQAPYEGVTKAQYEDLLAKMPKSIEWSHLVEKEDTTTGVQNLACTAGGCDI